MILEAWYKATKAKKFQIKEAIIQGFIHIEMNQSDHYFFDLHCSLFYC